MRLVTWNVNSLKARLGRVERWLERFEPDVVCLQETKLADDAFPALGFEALGYESFHHGQGRWNGVAILSRVGLDDPVAGFGDGGDADPEARIAWATCGGVRVATCYVPNGRSLDHDHYRYKLRWLERLGDDLAANADPAEPVVVCGDFNIAPEDRDVYDPTRFDGATHVSRPERDRLGELIDWGLVDVFREQHSEPGLFSWWDYRSGDFHKRKGMRIDLVLATVPVAAATDLVLIDRNERKGPKDDPPSDHAPVLVDFDLV
ncbi:MAG: exodeoxyribonuclease III [Acidimicrobiales bacterium]